MYNYEEQIRKYFNDEIALSKSEKVKLKSNCETNEDRIISKTDPLYKITKGSFVQQGSFAMRTTIKDPDNNYDIDDAIIFEGNVLIKNSGIDITPNELKSIVLDTLKDERFNTPPEKKKNCIRIYYNDGYHVDMACLRYNRLTRKLEIASSEWKSSNPYQINSWFNDKISSLNSELNGSGEQFRRMIMLFKRFTKSRSSWNMPCGLIITMLIAETFVGFERDDECLYNLIHSISSRLKNNLRVENLSDPESKREELTHSDADASMQELRAHLNEAIEHLGVLETVKCDAKEARIAWDWFFQTNGCFSEETDLIVNKMNLIRSGNAKTAKNGAIGVMGIANVAHKFYGE